MLTGTALASLALSICPSVQINREWRELHPVQQVAYLTAINCLKQLPSNFNSTGDSPKLTSRLEDFTWVYSQVSKTVEDNALFLPWHRAFLAVFDSALKQECGYNYVMPYWDWILDSEDPKESPVWKSFGQEGCIDIPGLGKWEVSYPPSPFKKPYCVSRKAGAMTLGGTDISPDVVKSYIKGNKGDYDGFRSDIETKVHKPIMEALMDTANAMNVPTNDPLYFLHIRNIDRLWVRWQLTKARNVLKFGKNDKSATLDFKGLFPSLTVRHVMSTKNGAAGGLMCYEYSDPNLEMKPLNIHLTFR